MYLALPFPTGDLHKTFHKTLIDELSNRKMRKQICTSFNLRVYKVLILHTLVKAFKEIRYVDLHLLRIF